MKENKPWTLLLAVLLSVSIHATVTSAADREHIAQDSSVLKIQRINGKVTLDGLSNEQAWKGITPLPVVMLMPTFGKTPTEKTEILIGYDDENLYVAGRLYDTEPDKITASSRRRDEQNPSNDWFGVVIDSFNDKENALCFFTTPTGLRLDMTVSEDALGEHSISMSWNTFWDAKATRNDKGWFAELRIPFSSLRFQDRNGRVVMGLISWRFIARKNETAIFPAINPKWGFMSSFKTSRAREVEFLGIRRKRPVYITPYALGGYGQTNDLNDNETAYLRSNNPVAEAGLDIKYSLTSNLTLDVTVNTDFAQVEADDAQVNLTRFSLFFPEKRLFFQERSSIFDFSLGGPNRLFYSRRIGLDDDEQQVRLLGGVRLIGRLGALDLGLISMQTARSETLPSENFSVLRLRKQVFNPNSYIGFMTTSRIGMDGTYNIAYGIDGIFRLVGDDYLVLNWAQTFMDREHNRILSLDPTRLRIDWERRTRKGFAYDLSYSRSGASYDPGMGFEAREDYSRIGTRLNYGWLSGEGSKMYRQGVFLNSEIYLANDSNDVESARAGPGYEFETKSGYGGEIAVFGHLEDVTEAFSFADDDPKEGEEDVPIGRYSFLCLEGMFMTPMGRRFALIINSYVGDFFDGRRLSLGFTPRWNVSSGLELSGFYQFNRINFHNRNHTFIAHIARLKVLAMFSTSLSASAFIQYNSSIDMVTANLRLRYNPREGNDLYLVYNEGINTDRYREIPLRPYTSDRTIMLKYTYTFQL